MSSRRVHRHHSCRLWVVADELRYQNLAARGKKEKAIPLGLIETVLLGPAMPQDAVKFDNCGSSQNMSEYARLLNPSQVAIKRALAGGAVMVDTIGAHE